MGIVVFLAFWCSLIMTEPGDKETTIKMAGYLAFPCGLILPPWATRSPVIAKSPSPGGAEPDGSCSLPGSYSLFGRDNGKEKGRGLPAKMAAEGETTTRDL